jgi:hypothetical protein
MDGVWTGNNFSLYSYPIAKLEWLTMCQLSTCIYIPLWGLQKWVVLLLLGKILVLFWDYKSSQIMNYSFRWELTLRYECYEKLK